MTIENDHSVVPLIVESLARLSRSDAEPRDTVLEIIAVKSAPHIPIRENPWPHENMRCLSGYLSLTCEFSRVPLSVKDALFRCVRCGVGEGGPPKPLGYNRMFLLKPFPLARIDFVIIRYEWVSVIPLRSTKLVECYPRRPAIMMFAISCKVPIELASAVNMAFARRYRGAALFTNVRLSADDGLVRE